jgi:mono/diheme cytochrome c family protein
MRAWPLRSAILAAALALAGLATDSASAQSVGDGERLARSVCMPCHVLPEGAGGREGPAFADIAALPSTTGLALTVFLQTSHGQMPNILLSREDIANLTAYILSLKPR